MTTDEIKLIAEEVSRLLEPRLHTIEIHLALLVDQTKSNNSRLHLLEQDRLDEMASPIPRSVKGSFPPAETP